MIEFGAFEEELKAVFDASVIVHNRVMAATSMSGRMMNFRIHNRICERFKELRYLHSLEHDVIIEKIRLEYE